MTRGGLAFATVSAALLLAQGPLEAQGVPLTAPAPTEFFSLTPCRAIDTRQLDGRVGGPASAGVARTGSSCCPESAAFPLEPRPFPSTSSSPAPAARATCGSTRAEDGSAGLLCQRRRWPELGEQRGGALEPDRRAGRVRRIGLGIRRVHPRRQRLLRPDAGRVDDHAGSDVGDEPVPLRRAVTFTATVTGAAGTPTGTVTFSDGVTRSARRSRSVPARRCSGHRRSRWERTR